MTTRRAIAYLRVSTDQQADSGLGLDAQRRAIEQAAQRHGLAMTAVYQDAGISGKDIESRPGLLEAVNALKRGDVLLIAKRDRLGRDVVAVALIERLITRKGAKVLSAAGEGTDSDDPTALLMRRIVDAFGEYERLLIGARTKSALRAKRARGLRAGNVPFGYASVRTARRSCPMSTSRRFIYHQESSKARPLAPVGRVRVERPWLTNSIRVGMAT
jgi:DNA invertase Pin-like site-specific DNA recombinase